MKMKFVLGIALAATLAVVTGCTNKQGQTESPVFVTVSIDSQPGFVNVAIPAAIQVETITLTSRLKDPTSIDTQHFADVQVNTYTVGYHRTDGGTLVPPMQTYSAGILLPSGGTSTLSNFPVMPAALVQGSPFDQLLPFNGGVDRETGRAEINLAYDLTFFGSTVSGKRVQSETASGLLIFQYFAVVPASMSK
jgi:hypothetical protein